MIESAESNNEVFSPGENYCIFGDESRTIVGRVFDYILRDGGESASFEWEYKEALR